MNSVRCFPTAEMTAKLVSIFNRLPQGQAFRIYELAREMFPDPPPTELNPDELFIFEYSQQEFDYVLSRGGVFDTSPRD